MASRWVRGVLLPTGPARARLYSGPTFFALKAGLHTLNIWAGSGWSYRLGEALALRNLRSRAALPN